MEDADIKKLRAILTSKGRQDLADLLIHSVSELEESSTLGSRWYSRLSKFYIKSHPSAYAKLDNLPINEKKEIFQALLLIYPLRDCEPEITEIIYLPDFDIDTTELVETKELDQISLEKITIQIRKANSKIADGDFDGAITNARTICEAILIHIIEEIEKIEIKNDGNLINLWTRAKKALKLVVDKDQVPAYVFQILAGLDTTINGLAGLSNNAGDRHASKFITKRHHAKLAVNSTLTFCDFLIDVLNTKK